MPEGQEQSRMLKPQACAVSCAFCNLPMLEIKDGQAIIYNRHHGQLHRNVVSIDWLRQQVEQLSHEASKAAA